MIAVRATLDGHTRRSESTDRLLLDHIPNVERVVLEVKGHNISNSAPDLCLDAVFAFYHKLALQGLPTYGSRGKRLKP